MHDVQTMGDGGDQARAARRKHLAAILDPVLHSALLDDTRWRSLALVFSISGQGRNFGNTGYAYGDGKDWWAISFPVPEIRPPVLAYAKSVRGDDLPDTLFRVLLQYVRETRQTKLLIEFDQPDRWAIIPQNARGHLEALRPDFAS